MKHFLQLNDNSNISKLCYFHNISSLHRGFTALYYYINMFYIKIIIGNKLTNILSLYY